MNSWVYYGGDLNDKRADLPFFIDFIQGHSKSTVGPVNARNSIVIDGEWSRVEIQFTIPVGTDSIKVMSAGDQKSDAVTYFDELMIRTLDATILARGWDRRSGPYLEFNNHKIRLSLDDPEKPMSYRDFSIARN